MVVAIEIRQVIYQRSNPLWFHNLDLLGSRKFDFKKKNCSDTKWKFRDLNYDTPKKGLMGVYLFMVKIILF